MFLKSIKINKDIILESDRKSQEKFFEINEYVYPSRSNPNKMIKTYDFIIHRKGFILEFCDPITIIVGDNGTGKSHLLNYIQPTWQKSKGFDLDQDRSKEAKYWLDNDKYTLRFIGQPEMIIFKNDIHKNSLSKDFDNPINPSNNSVITNYFRSGFSNGENVLDFLESLKEVKNALIILDEPETSLSLKSQKIISELFKELSKSNQLIIVTHSSSIMSLCDKVFDFETRNYIGTAEYIFNQLN